MGALAIGLATNFGLANTIVQERAPAHLRGRISAVFGLSFFGLMPIAGLVITSLVGPDRNAARDGSRRRCSMRPARSSSLSRCEHTIPTDAAAGSPAASRAGASRNRQSELVPR